MFLLCDALCQACVRVCARACHMTEANKQLVQSGERKATLKGSVCNSGVREPCYHSFKVSRLEGLEGL